MKIRSQGDRRGKKLNARGNAHVVVLGLVRGGILGFQGFCHNSIRFTVSVELSSLPSERSVTLVRGGGFGSDPYLPHGRGALDREGGDRREVLPVRGNLKELTECWWCGHAGNHIRRAAWS